MSIPPFREFLLTIAGIYGILSLALPMERWALHNGRRFATPPEKGVMVMPITLTFHILRWTVTIKVKSGNRHSAK